MGFDFSGSKARKDARQTFGASSGILNTGATQARGELNTGFDQAQGFHGNALSGLDGGYDRADELLASGGDRSIEYLDPYIKDGSRSSGMYGNALGLNGVQAQQDFGQNYAANDPFRQQNSGFATEDIMRSLNARGMSGSGYAAEAVAQQSLRRGSEDYNNYLNRLSGVRDSGQQAATNAASITGNVAGQRAQNFTQQGGQRADIYGRMATNATDRGNALSNLTYGNAQQIAGQRVSLGNSLAATRSQGLNNLLKIGELGTKAASAAMGMPA